MSGTSTPGKRSISEVDNDLPHFDDPADLVNAVISSLQCPDDKTNVSMNYSNEKNLAAEVQAYAKISGANWTFYVKSLAISIGRNTDNQPNQSNSIDIDLGPAKVVSRQHATITYNLDLRCWELKILGRNGAKVDGHKVNVESAPTPLHSGAILDIGGTQMMFILPDSPPKLDKRLMEICLTRYKQNMNKSKRASFSYYPQQHTLVPQMNKGLQMFDNNNLNHSPSQVSASSLQSNLDQDLSREESKDIKPPYSYATMITQAILSNSDGVMSLSEIYDWIADHYAYYKYSKTGWQNSIRHNLSLNKAFEKVPRRPNEPGKGMKWQISESYKDEFLSKVSNGSISKARRGSSVSRQLQLHLATHQALPESGKYYSRDEKPDFGHLRNSSLNKNFMNNLYYPQQPNQPPQPNNQQQQPHLQMPLPPQPDQSQGQQPPLSNGNGFMSMSGMNYQPMMYNMPNQTSPLKQLNDMNTPRLPKTNNNLYNLPPPPPLTSNNLGTSAPANHSRSNSYNQPLNESFPTSESNSLNQNTNATSDLALGFTSPKKVAPLEAFTPERGSKSHAKNLSVPNGLNTNQSSPAFWNFVQFSTPNGQTPMRKNSDELNEVSPTLNRKLNDSKDLSPIKSKRESTEST